MCFAAQRTCIIHGGLLGKEIIIFNEIKSVHYITNVLFFVTFYYNIKEKYFVLDCHNVLFINKGVSIDLLGNLVDISGGLGKEML